MIHIEVVAAIIHDTEGRIFATQRGYGELSTEISVDEFFCTVEYDYPKFHLTMHCYLCSLLSEALHLNEHEAAKWLSKDELDSVKWLPADKSIIEQLKSH